MDPKRQYATKYVYILKKGKNHTEVLESLNKLIYNYC